MRGVLGLGLQISIGAASRFVQEIKSFVINLLIATSTRVTTRTVWAYASDALYTDDPVITELAIGEVAITNGRRISEGVWSPVDVNGVPFSPAPTMSNEDSTTNKCECRKANPTDTTNLTKLGDAASTLTVVDDAAKLSSAGLSGVCSSGKVYKLDNSIGVDDAFVLVGGVTGNTNIHSGSIQVRGGSGLFYLTGDTVTQTVISADADYSKILYENKTPDTGARSLIVFADPGQVLYFILPQLEESPVATSIYYGDDTAAAATRGPDINTVPVWSGHTKDLGFERLEFTPYVGGQVNKYLRSFYIDATHTLDLYINATQVIASYVDGASTDSAAFTYSHLQDVPMTAEFGWDSVANKLRVRAAASSGDISGETFAEATFAGLTSLPATSYIGCKNDSSQAAGEFGNPIDYISAEVAGVL